MTDILEFTADDWFYVRGRGWAAAITNDNDAQLPTYLEPRDLLSRHVYIDNKIYFVIGVETQGYSRRQFGLLVRGEK